MFATVLNSVRERPGEAVLRSGVASLLSFAISIPSLATVKTRAITP